MPSFADVGNYLDETRLEAELSDAVAQCVEEERPQPLAAIADRLYERAAAIAVDWDFAALAADVRELIRNERCGPQLVQLSFADAATFSMAFGDGGPNAALRFPDSAEATFACNAGLATRTVPLLERIKSKYPNVGRADLWAFAANVAIGEMGGPTVLTRFGRRDAASSAESVSSAEGRLPDDIGRGDEEDKVAHLRAIFGSKGLADREIVALCGRHTVGSFEGPSGDGGGAWTATPQRFDNSFFTELTSKRYEPAAAGSSGLLMRCPTSGTIMLPTDHALLKDPKLRLWAEKFAADQPTFFEAFTAAWTRLQELGCARLAPHPGSLTYASSCILPCEWTERRMISRREVNHDTTLYSFELPTGASLQLPSCACLLVRAPQRGRGGKGKDDFDGSDAVRPYTPITDDGVVGKFELMVKRCACAGRMP